MIAGYHLIWTVYGYWLPNDPRGSMSREIRSASIADLGEIHYGRKRIQPAGRVMREFHEAAKARLKHPLLDFTDAEVRAVGAAFAEVVRRRNYTCYACAILPDHVHLLVRKHRDQAEAMIAQFQEASRDAVLRFGTRPLDHPVWGGPGWKVYLETRDDITRTIVYIGKNFVQFGLPEQTWPFVKPYDGWLPAQVRVVRRTSPRLADGR
jgi:REP element-mobilizing transposase RayT